MVVLTFESELRELCSVFYLGNDPHSNPYVDHIYGLATSVAAVRFATASSASCHLATRLKDTKLDLQCLRLRTAATNLLRKRLAVCDPSEVPTNLASILVLAQLDVSGLAPVVLWWLTQCEQMCSGYCTEFDIHLRAGLDIIRNHGDFSPAPFLVQRLMWQVLANPYLNLAANII